MVFRKENKVDSFQRQISALRQQLGTPEDEAGEDDVAGRMASAEPVEAPPVATPPSPSRDYDSYASYAPITPVEPAAPVMPILPETRLPDAQTSVVAHDTIWKGDLQTNGSLHVHGRVEGSLAARDDIYVAEEADVDATVTAKNVVIAGMVRGTVRCSERFEVLPQGRVAGDIQAPTLVIHEGAMVTGQFRMGAAGQGDASAASAAPATARPAVVQRRAARGGR